MAGIVGGLTDQASTLGALGAVGAAFVAMLRILSRPDSRWQPLVDELRGELDRLKAENSDLRSRLAEREAE